MDTIDFFAMVDVAAHVETSGSSMPIIHTVTVTLDGATGGLKVTIEGFTSDELDEALTHERNVP